MTLNTYPSYNPHGFILLLLVVAEITFELDLASRACQIEQIVNRDAVLEFNPEENDPDFIDTPQDGLEMASVYTQMAITTEQRDECHHQGPECGYYPEDVAVVILSPNGRSENNELSNEPIVSEERLEAARNNVLRTLTQKRTGLVCVKCKGIGNPGTKCRFATSSE